MRSLAGDSKRSSVVFQCALSGIAMESVSLHLEGQMPVGGSADGAKHCGQWKVVGQVLQGGGDTCQGVEGLPGNQDAERYLPYLDMQLAVLVHAGPCKAARRAPLR